MGDPRARTVIDALALSPEMNELMMHLRQAGYDQPNIDFALALLTHELGLPAEAPFLIFAQARMAGWLAHSIEQATQGRPIRPRAIFTGARPAQ